MAGLSGVLARVWCRLMKRIQCADGVVEGVGCVGVDRDGEDVMNFYSFFFGCFLNCLTYLLWAWSRLSFLRRILFTFSCISSSLMVGRCRYSSSNSLYTFHALELVSNLRGTAVSMVYSTYRRRSRYSKATYCGSWRYFSRSEVSDRMACTAYDHVRHSASAGDGSRFGLRVTS